LIDRIDEVTQVFLYEISQMLEKKRPDPKLKFEEKHVEIFKTTYELTEHIHKDTTENIG
jgi:hypothetical protein